MRHLPEKKQNLRPPAGIAPLLLAVAFVLVLAAVVVGAATAQ